MKKALKLLLLIGWMILIFMFSNQNGNDSSNTSSMFSSLIYNVFNYISGGNIISQVDFLERFIPIIRKLAHFSEYLILGVLSYLNIIEYSFTKNILKAILFSSIYASSDEIHQLFIENRNGSIFDVMIDISGAIVGILICHCILKKWKKSY